MVDAKQHGMLENAVHTLFLTTRDTANREATCDMIEEHTKMVGEYGSVSVAGK